MHAYSITSARLCADCSVDISGRGHRALRCAMCQREYRRNQNRLRWAWTDNPSCQDCGTPLPRTPEHPRVRRICTPCSTRKGHAQYRSKPEKRALERAYMASKRQDLDWLAQERERNRKYDDSRRGDPRRRASNADREQAKRDSGQAKNQERERYYADPDFRARKIARASARVMNRRRVRKERLWDRQNGKCGICKKAMAFAGAHIDHIVPLAKGGTWAYNNLQLTHPKCNLHKSSNIPNGFQIELGQVNPNAIA